MAGETRFAGRNAVVTGGASGIGWAVAQRLRAEGAAVAVWDRTGVPEASGIRALPST